MKHEQCKDVIGNRTKSHRGWLGAFSLSSGSKLQGCAIQTRCRLSIVATDVRR